MALVKCSECQNEISSKAKTCPHCGYSHSKYSFLPGPIRWALYAFIVYLVFVFFNAFSKFSSIKKESQRASEQAALQQEPLSQTPSPQWQYSDSTDKMTGKPIKQASIDSNSFVVLNPPYSNKTTATLILRSHPRHGRDAIINLSSGQSLCKSYEDCILLIRFDNDPATEYSGIGPSDYSTDTIFIRNYSRFTSRLRTAKKVLIQIPMYEAGGAAWEFSTTNLNWDQPTISKPGLTPYQRRMQGG